MKILIVEDDFVCRKKMQKILSSLGETDIAMNGKEAVEAFKISLKNKAPYDLITMDINMPDMDGHEATRQIRSIEDKQRKKARKTILNVKIVMMSALNDSKNIMSALLKNGADGYLVKPVNEAKIIETFKKIDLL